MRFCKVLWMGGWVLAGAACLAQNAAPAARTSRYLPGPALDLHTLVAGPPAAGSAEAKADLAEVLKVQRSRTPAQVKAAQRDDRDESIFAFATVLGPRFRAEDLPLTAALSAHLREESGVVNPGLKTAFHRPRPFRALASVHPVCAQTASDSYPSGHAMVGYLEGFALTEMLPERAGEILARAQEFARNRVVCGVHYPSDTEASRTIALALFGALLSSASMQAELAAARVEVEKTLAQETR